MQIEIRGVERLSFRERQVVALKETGHGNQAIARRLGISLATVATLYSRAKAKGYQVVLVLSGDPLNLYAGGADDADDGTEGEDGPHDSGPVGPADKKAITNRGDEADGTEGEGETTLA